MTPTAISVRLFVITSSNKTSFYMKQFATFALVCCISISCFAQKLSNVYESSLKQNSSVEFFEMSKPLGTPSFITFKSTKLPEANNAESLIKELFKFQSTSSLSMPVTTELQEGITVVKYKQVFRGVPVEHSAIIVNQKDGKIHSIASEFFDFSNVNNSVNSLSEKAALDKAISFVNATEYAWEAIEKDKITFKSNPDMVARLSQLEEAQKPKGLLVYARDIYGSNTPRLAWKFNVYAMQPLSRHYIYVDAENGKILLADCDWAGTRPVVNRYK